MKAKKGKTNKSWVENSVENLKYFIGADFVDQLEAKLGHHGLTQRTFAEKLGVTEGRVSQIFNNPGNLTLDTMVSWGQIVGMKTSVILYGESVDEHLRGPLSGQIFYDCWKLMGSPRINMLEGVANPASGSVHCNYASSQNNKISGVEEISKTVSSGEAVFVEHFSSLMDQSALQRQYSRDEACGLSV